MPPLPPPCSPSPHDHGHVAVEAEGGEEVDGREVGGRQRQVAVPRLVLRGGGGGRRGEGGVSAKVSE